MTSAFKPSELANTESEKIRCPHCGDISSVAHPHYVSDELLECVSCCCSKIVAFESPEIAKKLIYLDQWFVSEITSDDANSGKRAKYRRLMQRLTELCQCEKAAIIVSHLNLSETAAMGHDHHRDETWQQFNQLSTSTLTRPEIDTIIAQHKRIIANPDSEAHWSDILEESPHKLRIQSIVRTTRAPLKKLLQIENSTAIDFNAIAKELIENQLSQLPDNADLDTCHQLIKKLAIRDLLDGCEYPDNPNSEKGYLKYHKYVKPLCNELIGTGMTQHEAMQAIAGGGTPQLPPSTQLSVLLEGMTLNRARSAVKQSGNITANPKKFSSTYGSTRHRDYSHISTYAPYVDVILTDNSVATLMTDGQVESIGINLDCQIFSDQSISDFERLLEEFENTPENEERAILRKLVSGFTEIEQKDRLKSALRKAVKDILKEMGQDIDL